MRYRNNQLKWTHVNSGVQKDVLYPILEATEPLLFTVTDKDISKAHNLKGYGDPNCCVAACAVRRQNEDAIFQRDTAYLLKVFSGIVHAVRYRFGSSLRAAVALFDNGGEFPTGNYKLLPPTASQTLASKRLRARNGALTKRTVRKHTKFSARGKVTPLS